MQPATRHVDLDDPDYGAPFGTGRRAVHGSGTRAAAWSDPEPSGPLFSSVDSPLRPDGYSSSERRGVPTRRAVVTAALGTAGLAAAGTAVAWRLGLLDDRLAPTGAPGSPVADAAGGPAASPPAGQPSPPAAPAPAAGPAATAAVDANGGTAAGGPTVAIDPVTGLPAPGGTAVPGTKAGGPKPGATRSGTPKTGGTKAGGTKAGGAAASGTRGAATAGAGAGRTGAGTPGGKGQKAAPVPVAARATPELVLLRATYGATPQLRAEIAKAGISEWLGRQLAPATLPDPDGDAIAAMYPTLSRSRQSLHAAFEAKQEGLEPVRDLQAAHLGRAIWSRRQLFEVMVGFWSDHFTVPTSSDDARITRADYDRTVIRTYALGRFEDLLVAVAHHPAMLTYLNLAGSTGANPNENFARELLELHTVGVDGGYTEADIKQAAKLLTGLRLEKDTTVVYDPARHYVGAVKVMGFSNANADAAGGPAAARALYRYLAHHPSTARFLATKLARRFVSDTPPPRLVAELATVYLASDTQIGPVLRALFSSDEFAVSGGQKLRRPMEHLAAVARAVGLRPGSDPKTLRDAVRMLGSAGHLPFEWSTPDGYPDVAASWQSAGQALAQFSTATNLLRGYWPKGFGTPALASLLADPAKATTPAAIADQLARHLLGRAPTAAETAAVTTILSGPGFPRTYTPGAAQNEAVATATILLLHSPAFLTR